MQKFLGYFLMIGGIAILILDTYLYLSNKEAGSIPFLRGLIAFILGVILIKRAKG